MTNSTFLTSCAVSGLLSPGNPNQAESAARREELATNVQVMCERVRNAAASCGRDPGAVTLIAVTKGFPASDIEHLVALGVTDIGENKDQEARSKLASLEPMLRQAGVRVHFIGQLQTNKCRSVVRYADMVQAVDRVELVNTLDKACAAASRHIAVLLQVNLNEQTASQECSADVPSRGGVVPGGMAALAESITASGRLDLAGVMAVAPRGADPAAAFDRLRNISAKLCQTYPAANAISAGMSGDFELAIKHGATHVRVGSALLGHR